MGVQQGYLFLKKPYIHPMKKLLLLPVMFAGLMVSAQRDTAPFFCGEYRTAVCGCMLL